MAGRRRFKTVEAMREGFTALLNRWSLLLQRRLLHSYAHDGFAKNHGGRQQTANLN